MLDIGTGDGMFVYRSALAEAHKFFIGIDPNRKPLEKISQRIYRKTAKGGVTNAMFVQAAVEDLPAELSDIASEVYVNFPWGSLLRTVAGGDVAGLKQIRAVCSEQAKVRIVFGVDPVRDRAEMERLQLPELTVNYLASTLTKNYRLAGLEIVERRRLDTTDSVHAVTSWGRRLRQNTKRTGFYIVARPV